MKLNELEKPKTDGQSSCQWGEKMSQNFFIKGVYERSFDSSNFFVLSRGDRNFCIRGTLRREMCSCCEIAYVVVAGWVLVAITFNAALPVHRAKPSSCTRRRRYGNHLFVKFSNSPPPLSLSLSPSPQLPVLSAANCINCPDVNCPSSRFLATLSSL